LNTAFIEIHVGGQGPSRDARGEREKRRSAGT
jgi:hypothetical protein